MKEVLSLFSYDYLFQFYSEEKIITKNPKEQNKTNKNIALSIELFLHFVCFSYMGPWNVTKEKRGNNVRHGHEDRPMV